MGFLDECHGFIVDGDMAARWGVTSPHMIQGRDLRVYPVVRGILADMSSMQETHGLVPNGLVDTLWSPYLHPPVSDPESSYHTAQWAVVSNDGASGGKYTGTGIQGFQGMIAGDRRERAGIKVQSLLLPLTAKEGYGPFFAHSLVILTPWFTKFTALNRDQSLAMRKVATFDDKDKKHLGLDFSIYGCCGVGEYFELIREHRALLQEVV